MCVCVRHTPVRGSAGWKELLTHLDIDHQGKCCAPILLRKLLLLNPIANPPYILLSKHFTNLASCYAS